jgi:VIT1/CCC1 family predicted Fe2+/Mn2+ transporter/rubrerythrin
MTETNEQISIDQKSISTWKYHLQDEVDAAFLYKTLAGLIRNEKQRGIYLQLAKIEDRHTEVWEKLLSDYNIVIEKRKPSIKANILAWYSKKFGTAFLSKFMLKEEAAEVKSYLGLYRESDFKQTKDIALKLAKDSAEHANRLMEPGGDAGEPWHQSESGGILRNVVYGFNDGLTANFGLIAGVIGASAAPHIILISGIAGLVADALSMGSSGYLAAVSEKEVYDHERKMEADEIKLMPELETEELALIYQSKGMEKEAAQNLAVEAMKNPDQVLEDKVREELGIVERPVSPLREGWITGAATAVGAFIPVFSFIFFSGTVAVWVAFIISMLSHFGVGAARSFFTGRGIFRSGFDMFIVGFGVAAAGYFIGELILRLL